MKITVNANIDNANDSSPARFTVLRWSFTATQQTVERISWTGSLLGVVGAGTLALNMPWSGVGWYLFLGSNSSWIAYALFKRVPSLLLMQIAFTLTSLLGVFRWSI